MRIEDVISIGTNCLVKSVIAFFLLVEIEVEAGNVEIEEKIRVY